MRSAANSSQACSEIEKLGFAFAREVLSPQECEELITLLGPVTGAGRRHLLADPAVARLATSERLLGLIRPHLVEGPSAVRAIYFDKSPDANWLVPWHQDLTLAVRERIDLPEFGPWSIKDGMPHVQPPSHLLAQMLTLRLHLDDADESNGALRVLPGSHSHGKLNAAQIGTWRDTQAAFTCRAKAGDALLMRPLLLHASSRSTNSAHRRILHIEYAGFALPAGLHWHVTT
jgi:hypothetical protein